MGVAFRRTKTLTSDGVFGSTRSSTGVEPDDVRLNKLMMIASLSAEGVSLTDIPLDGARLMSTVVLAPDERLTALRLRRRLLPGHESRLMEMTGEFIDEENSPINMLLFDIRV